MRKSTKIRCFWLSVSIVIPLASMCVWHAMTDASCDSVNLARSTLFDGVLYAYYHPEAASFRTEDLAKPPVYGTSSSPSGSFVTRGDITEFRWREEALGGLLWRTHSITADLTSSEVYDELSYFFSWNPHLTQRTHENYEYAVALLRYYHENEGQSEGKSDTRFQHENGEPSA